MKPNALRSSIETFIVVTIITLLVWLYAEGESVKAYDNQSVPIRFISPGEDDVTIRPAGDQRVLISFEGSTGQFQALQTLVERQPIEIPVLETQTISLKDRLNRALADLGIQVLTVDPEAIPVTVQRIEQVELPIEVALPDVQLAGVPQVEPETMVVRLPSGLVEAADDLSLTARLDQLDLSGLEVNVPLTREAPLTLPPALAGQQVRLPRESVSVRFTIQRLTDNVSLTTVPIHINAPPLLLKRYDIDLPPDGVVLTDVKLSGPADAIADIREGRYKVWAELRPSADDLEAQLRTDAEPLQLHLHIPQGVRIDSPLPRIPLDVTRREE